MDIILPQSHHSIHSKKVQNLVVNILIAIMIIWFSGKLYLCRNLIYEKQQ